MFNKQIYEKYYKTKEYRIAFSRNYMNAFVFAPMSTVFTIMMFSSINSVNMFELIPCIFMLISTCIMWAYFIINFTRKPSVINTAIIKEQNIEIDKDGHKTESYIVCVGTNYYRAIKAINNERIYQKDDEVYFVAFGNKAKTGYIL